MAKLSKLSKATREIIVGIGKVKDVSETLKKFDAIHKSNIVQYRGGNRRLDCKYSNSRSIRFWEIIHWICKKNDNFSLYDKACDLQELEGKILFKINLELQSVKATQKNLSKKKERNKRRNCD